MEPSKAAMKAALRVLTALSERQEPNPADVDELHWYVPSDRQRPLDELVCDAIQRAMQDREHQRKTAKEQLREQVLGRLPRLQKPASEPRPDARHREESRLEYLTLTSKLRELGTALQQAAATLSAVDLNRDAVDSDAAKKALESVGKEVDLSGVIQLLNDHARLTKQISANLPQPKPKD